jgi:hypothetical protein
MRSFAWRFLTEVSEMAGKSKFKVCSECGVPRRISKENLWLNNGKIVEKKNPSHGMIFIENENILAVFETIESLLGFSIERIIVESERKQAYDYVDNFVPDILKKIVRRIPFDLSSKKVTSQGQLMGYGDIRVVSKRIKHDGGDFFKLGVRNMWFPAAFTGIVAGSLEALMGTDFDVTCKEVSPGYHEVLASVFTSPREFEERLPVPEYSNKQGDTGLERCGACGGPRELGGFEWRMDDGIIVNRSTGQRMILVGPAEFETIFVELANELGEDITRMVIEAQRRFVKSGSFAAGDSREPGRLGKQLALRGLGNLREMGWADGQLRLRLENPCLTPALIGMALGLFELSTGRDGEVEWSQADDGDLTVEIKPV